MKKMKEMKLNCISNEYYNHVEGQRRKEGEKGKKQGKEGRREILKVWCPCPEQLEKLPSGIRSSGTAGSQCFCLTLLLIPNIVF